MAIKWNATTKKWVCGSIAVAATTLLILPLCKPCDVQDAANDAKQTAVEDLQDDVTLVEIAVDNAQRTADEAKNEIKVHRDSTIAQGVHQAAAKQR